MKGGEGGTSEGGVQVGVLRVVCVRSGISWVRVLRGECYMREEPQCEAHVIERKAREEREDTVKSLLHVFCHHGDHEVDKFDVKHTEVQELAEAPVVCQMQRDNSCGREAESAYCLWE